MANAAAAVAITITDEPAPQKPSAHDWSGCAPGIAERCVCVCVCVSDVTAATQCPGQQNVHKSLDLHNSSHQI